MPGQTGGVADLDRYVGPSDQVADLDRLVGSPGDRLLAERGHTGLDRGKEQGEVRVRGGRDDDAVHTRVEQRLRGLDGASLGDPRGNRVGGSSDRVSDDKFADLAEVRKRVRMERPDPTESNETDTHQSCTPSCLGAVDDQARDDPAPVERRKTMKSAIL